jgi:hypothetical protein
MGSKIALFVTAVLAVGSIIPATASAHRHGLRHNYKHAYYKVVRMFGPQVAGRQIVSHGYLTKHGIRRATNTEVADSLRRLRAMATPPTPAQAAPVVTPATSSSTTTTTTTSSATTGPSSAGYCGAYQFDQQTWQSVGMSGSACGASPAQQDAAAQKLYAERGSAPWPVCGRYIPDWAAVRQCENSGSY